ncbi:MAG: hypothetical protein R2734_13050 [Nocardioides sp.]
MPTHGLVGAQASAVVMVAAFSARGVEPIMQARPGNGRGSVVRLTPGGVPQPAAALEASTAADLDPTAVVHVLRASPLSSRRWRGTNCAPRSAWKAQKTSPASCRRATGS